MTRSKGRPKDWRNQLYPKGAQVAERWPVRTLIERVVDKMQSGADPLDCVMWADKLNVYGYGRIRIDGKTLLAHRVVYELFVGEIPEGNTIDHLCRNRRCVHPFHLEAVTLAENKRRGESLPSLNARKTHCSRGHAYDEENTLVLTRGGRRCRACNRERSREKTIENRRRVERYCALSECGQPIPVSRTLPSKYCSQRCRRRQAHLLARAKLVAR